MRLSSRTAASRTPPFFAGRAAVVLAAVIGLLLSSPATATAASSGVMPAASANTATASAATAGVADSGIVKTTLVGFDPGTLIDDSLFYDGAAMTAAQIQSFLDQRIGRCQNGRCLNVLTVDISSRDARYSNSTGNLICSAIQGGSMRISELIYRVQTACGISAKVILVTLQKEQGLTTDSAPTEGELRAAMGASCPDTAPCDPAFSGVGPQIVGGVTQLKTYKAARFSRQPGTHYIQYSPTASCGGTNVNITNYATAALYNYTPYQPNAASLAAGSGLGNGCSSYGNRNFYNYYTDWFGSATTQNNPFGGYNLVTERGQFTVQGWALDPNARTTPLTIAVSLDGVSNWATFTADESRGDVAAAYPGYGTRSGMNKTFQVEGGDHRICITARNLGAGSDQDFGCTDVWIETASPYGGTTATAIPGGVQVTGWTLDTDTTESLAVHVYIDGVGSVYRADAFRPDVGQVFPGFGDNHGIDLTIPTALGSHEVCAYGINVGRGMNKLLGCQTVNVAQSADPVGALESLYPEPGGFHVKGWAADPNASGPLAVHIYRGTAGTILSTGVARPDVAGKIPFAGATAGYDAHIDAPAGTSTVCAYGINVGWGSNAGIGCGSVTVRSGNPFGGIDATANGTSVRVRGWAIDPDTTQSIPVHLYVDGVGRAVSANVVRNDVGAAYPGYGAAHGVDTTLELSPGQHSICAYGINSGAGGNALLNCVKVTVEDRSPFGGTDVSVEGTQVRVRGWAIDPDTTDPIAVHVYVDGVGKAVVKADVQRPDVARVYPAFGAAHGIDTLVDVGSGTHQVCSYGINQGAGSNVSLGCYTVTIP